MPSGIPKPRWAPPGTDPTLQEYELEKPNLRGCGMFALGFIIALAAGGILYWNVAKPNIVLGKAPEATKAPSQTWTATWTPSATNTPLPTSTGTVTPVPATDTPAATPSLLAFYSGPDTNVQLPSRSTMSRPDALPTWTPHPVTPSPTRVRPVGGGNSGGAPAPVQPPVNPIGSVSGPLAPPQTHYVTVWQPPSGPVTVHGVPVASVAPTGTQPTPAETWVPLSGQTATATDVPATEWVPLPDSSSTPTDAISETPVATMAATE